MTIDKKFIDQFIKVSSKAALASSYLVGKKDKIAADQAAVDSMRAELNKISIRNGSCWAIVIAEFGMPQVTSDKTDFDMSAGWPGVLLNVNKKPLNSNNMLARYSLCRFDLGILLTFIVQLLFL